MQALNAKYVQDEITALLLAHPELEEDEVLRADSIEGQTEAFEFLSRVVRKISGAKVMAKATADYAEELKGRKERLERREHALRSLVMKIMNAANLRKCELPEATLSIRNGQQKVLITNDLAIPDGFMRIKKEPDKTLIRAELIASGNVPGCALSNGEPSLTILVK
jgi:Siphovirus Gp157